MPPLIRRFFALILVPSLLLDAAMVHAWSPVVSSVVNPIYSVQAVPPKRGFYTRPDFDRTAEYVFRRIAVERHTGVGIGSPQNRQNRLRQILQPWESRSDFRNGLHNRNAVRGDFRRHNGTNGVEPSGSAAPRDLVSKQDKAKILAILREEGVSLPLKRIPPWLQHSKLVEQPDRGTRLNQLWFELKVLELAQAEAKRRNVEGPLTFQDALQPEWGWQVKPPRLTYHPLSLTECSFGHGLEYAYHVIHEPTQTRIVLGRGEIVTFGVMTDGEGKGRERGFLAQNQEKNSLYPHLSVAFALLRDPDILNALRGQPEFSVANHPRERAQLLGFAEVAIGRQSLGAMPVIGNPVSYSQGKTTLSVETLDQLLVVARRLAEQGLDMKGRHSIPTRLQALAWRTAVAQARARKGDFTGWDSLAAAISRYAEQMGTSFERMALLGRFAGLLADPEFTEGKSAGQIRRVASFASGPAVFVRVFLRISKMLTAKGMEPASMEFIQVDAARRVMQMGQEAIKRRRIAPHKPVPLKSIQSRLGQPSGIAEIATGSLDVAEMSIMNSLEPEEQVFFLLEMNRVVDDKDGGGYLLLTAKRPFSPALRPLLPRFGFQVLTEANARLFYSAGTRHRLAHGRKLSMRRIQERLTTSGYLIAVKTRTLPAEEIEALRQDSAIRQVLKLPEGPEKEEGEEEVVHRRLQPQDHQLKNLAYNEMGDEDFTFTGIHRNTILAPNSPYQRFEEHLSCLWWGTHYLTSRETGRLERLIRTWADTNDDIMPRRDVDWVMARVQKVPKELATKDPTEKEKDSARPSPDDIAPFPVKAEETTNTDGETIWDMYQFADLDRLTTDRPSLLDEFRSFYNLRVGTPEAAPKSAPSSSADSKAGSSASPANRVSPDDIAPEPPAVPVFPTGGRSPQLVLEVPPLDEAAMLQVLNEIRARNTNPEANNRLQPGLIGDLLKTIKGAQKESQRDWAVGKILDAKPRIKGVTAREVYEIFGQVGLVERPVTPLPPEPIQEVIEPTSPTPASAPVRTFEPQVPQPPTPKPSPTLVAASAQRPIDPEIRLASLKRLEAFVHTYFERGIFDFDSWLRMASDLSDNIGPVPEALKQKTLWASHKGNAGANPYMLYIVANDWLEKLNYSYLAPQGRLIHMTYSLADARWKSHLVKVHSAPNDSFTVVLPAFQEGTFSLGEESLPMKIFQTNHNPEDQSQRSVGSVSHNSIGVIMWGKVTDQAAENLALVFDTAEKYLPHIPLVVAWRKRLEKREPRELLANEVERIRWRNQVSIVLTEECKRLAIAGYTGSNPLIRKEDIPPQLGHNAATFLNAYLDRHGILLAALEKLSPALMPSSSDLMSVCITLHQLGSSNPTRMVFEDIVTAHITSHGSQRYHPSRLLTLFLIATYIDPTQSWDLAGMLRDGKIDPAIIESIGKHFDGASEDYLTQVGQLLLNENFRAHVVRDNGNELRLVRSDRPTPEKLHLLTAGKIGNLVKSVYKEGHAGVSALQPAMDALMEQRIPTETFHGAARALDVPPFSMTAERAYRLQTFARPFNDQYLGPRGAILTIGQTPRGLEPVWLPGVEREEPYRVQGLWNSEIPMYRMRRPVAINTEMPWLWNSPEFGLISSPEFMRAEFLKTFRQLQQDRKALKGQLKAGADPALVVERKVHHDEWARWLTKGYGLEDVTDPKFTRSLFQNAFLSHLVPAATVSNGLPDTVDDTEERLRQEFDRKSTTILPALAFLRRHLRSESSLNEILEGKANYSSFSLPHRMGMVMGLFSHLHEIIESSDPARFFAMAFMTIPISKLSNSPTALGPDTRLLLFSFLQERTILKHAILREMSILEILSMPSTHDRWLVISDEFHSMSKPELIAIAETLLRKHFTVRFRISQETRTIDVQPITEEADKGAALSPTERHESRLDADIVLRIAMFLSSALENDLHLKNVDWGVLKTALESVLASPLPKIIQKTAEETLSIMRPGSPFSALRRQTAFYDLIKVINEKLLMPAQWVFRITTQVPISTERLQIVGNITPVMKVTLPNGNQIEPPVFAIKQGSSLELNSGILIQETMIAQHKSDPGFRVALGLAYALSAWGRELYSATLSHVNVAFFDKHATRTDGHPLIVAERITRRTSPFYAYVDPQMNQTPWSAAAEPAELLVITLTHLAAMKFSTKPSSHWKQFIDTLEPFAKDHQGIPKAAKLPPEVSSCSWTLSLLEQSWSGDLKNLPGRRVEHNIDNSNRILKQIKSELGEEGIRQLADKIITDHFSLAIDYNAEKNHLILRETKEGPPAGALKEVLTVAQARTVVSQEKKKFTQLLSQIFDEFEKVCKDYPKDMDAWMSTIHLPAQRELIKMAERIDSLANQFGNKQLGLSKVEHGYYRAAAVVGQPKLFEENSMKVRAFMAEILSTSGFLGSFGQQNEWNDLDGPQAMSLEGIFTQIINSMRYEHKIKARSDETLKMIQSMRKETYLYLDQTVGITVGAQFADGKKIYAILINSALSSVEAMSFYAGQMIYRYVLQAESARPHLWSAAMPGAVQPEPWLWAQIAFKALAWSRFKGEESSGPLSTVDRLTNHMLIYMEVFEKIQQHPLPNEADDQVALIRRVVDEAIASYRSEFRRAGQRVPEDKFPMFKHSATGAALGGLSLMLARNNRPSETSIEKLSVMAGKSLRDLTHGGPPTTLKEAVMRMNTAITTNRSETLHRAPDWLKPFLNLGTLTFVDEIFHLIGNYGLIEGLRRTWENPSAIWDGELDVSDSRHKVQGVLVGVAASIYTGMVLMTFGGDSLVYYWGVATLLRTAVDFLLITITPDHELWIPIRHLFENTKAVVPEGFVVPMQMADQSAQAGNEPPAKPDRNRIVPPELSEAGQRILEYAKTYPARTFTVKTLSDVWGLRDTSSQDLKTQINLLIESGWISRAGQHYQYSPLWPAPSGKRDSAEEIVLSWATEHRGQIIESTIEKTAKELRVPLELLVQWSWEFGIVFGGALKLGKQEWVADWKIDPHIPLLKFSQIPEDWAASLNHHIIVSELRRIAEYLDLPVRVASALLRRHQVIWTRRNPVPVKPSLRRAA